MKKQQLYIVITVLIILLIFGLIGWAAFIGRQQQELQKETEDLGYFTNPSGSSRGQGLFGGIVNEVFGTDTDTKTQERVDPILRQLYNLPTSGYSAETEEVVRFVDRATGHIFEKTLADENTVRIDQTTIPQVYESLFVNNDSGIIRRYLNENNDIVSIYSSTTDGKEANISLPLNITRIVSNPNGGEVAFLVKTANGSDVILYNLVEKKQRVLWSSTLRGWDIAWTKNAIVVTQNPSANLPGSAYVIKLSSGTYTLLLQQEPGLITNSDVSGVKILYSTINSNGVPILSVKNLEKNTDQTFDIKTFADKCTWHPDGTIVYCAVPNTFPQEVYPDAWYQGKVHFSDTLWKIDTQTNTISQIFAPIVRTGLSLDMVDLTINEDDDSVFFINKTDQTLWSITFPKEKDVESGTISNTEDNIE